MSTTNRNQARCDLIDDDKEQFPVVISDGMETRVEIKKELDSNDFKTTQSDQAHVPETQQEKTYRDIVYILQGKVKKVTRKKEEYENYDVDPSQFVQIDMKVSDETNIASDVCEKAVKVETDHEIVEGDVEEIVHEKIVTVNIKQEIVDDIGDIEPNNLCPPVINNSMLPLEPGTSNGSTNSSQIKSTQPMKSARSKKKHKNSEKKVQRALKTNANYEPYECSMCDFKSVERHRLNSHIKIHSDPPLECSMCDYKAFKKCNMERHVRKHTGNLPYQCSMCDYKAAMKFDLNKHIRIHTGERPYLCTMCDYKCISSSNLKLHLRRHTASLEKMADKKRKHETLSLSKKMEILRKLDKGQSQVKLADEYGVGRATIYDIKKNREKIESFANTADSETSSRQTLKTGEYPLMEDALYAWFLQERRRNTPLTGDIIRQKALIFYEKIYKNSSFKASDGWFQKFKTRYGIRMLAVTGEKLYMITSAAVAPFIKKFKKKVHELNLSAE